MSEVWSSSDPSEARRLAILASYPLDRKGTGPQLDALARLAAKICDAPTGLVSLVEGDRQRFVGKSGIDVDETPREWSFCAHAMHRQDAMVVPDASIDPTFRDNPLVTGEATLRFYAGHPLRSAEGAPLGSLCIIDNKPREALSDDQLFGLRTLADAAMALLERWRIENNTRARAAEAQSTLHDLTQRFQVLADVMPQMVWSSLASGHSDYFNSQWADFTGTPASASWGDAWMQFLHRDDKDKVAQVWRDAVATGGTYDLEYRLRRHDGEYRWMLVRGYPMKDEAGAIYRWLGTCTDIQEQKALAEQQDLLTRELSHRIKNIFAVIGGLITLSLRRRPELKEAGGDLQQRVLALGRAHDFVRPHSEYSRSHHSHSSLHGMLISLLAAYQAEPGERVRIDGADVRIDDRSATPLALFFHELATNAVKYGALSTGDGHVEIGVEPHGQDIVLTWTEHGGPAVTPATAQGFGGSLIEMSVTRQLGGKLDYDWRAEGLSVQARIPAQTMAR